MTRYVRMPIHHAIAQSGSLELTDATGSGADIVRVSVSKVTGESL